MSLTIPISLLAIHFIADFILQNDWMALNKSKNSVIGLKALLTHVTIYSICFSWLGAAFVAITWILHFIVDAITSRITSKLWFLPLTPIYWHGPEEHPQQYVTTPKTHLRHWFFVMIGLDQLIHYGCLTWTLKFLNF